MRSIHACNERRMTTRSSSAALLASLALSGCAMMGSTWSEVTGIRYNRTIEYRVPVAVTQIDDQSAFGESPISVAPGRHVVRVEAHPPGYYGGLRRREITIDMQPCRRYYVNAQFANFTDPEFTPVIDHEEAIAGCKVPGP
jgi:hypothetical protein